MSPSARRLQYFAAIGSAAVMSIGVIAFDWPTFTVLAFYWLENVIVGGFTALRLLAAGARTERYVESLASTVFFSLHYGLFCLVHGALLATLFGGIHTVGGIADPVLLMVGRIAGDRIGLLVVFALIVAAALDAWRAAATLDAGDAKAIRAIMTEPYGRIVVLHLVLIAGGFLMVALQLPSLAALLLVAFKLAHDLGRLRRGGAASAQRVAGDRPPP